MWPSASVYFFKSSAALPRRYHEFPQRWRAFAALSVFYLLPNRYLKNPQSLAVQGFAGFHKGMRYRPGITFLDEFAEILKIFNKFCNLYGVFKTEQTA